MIYILALKSNALAISTPKANNPNSNLISAQLNHPYSHLPHLSHNLFLQYPYNNWPFPSIINSKFPHFKILPTMQYSNVNPPLPPFNHPPPLPPIHLPPPLPRSPPPWAPPGHTNYNLTPGHPPNATSPSEQNSSTDRSLCNGKNLTASRLHFNPLSDEMKDTFVELNDTLNNCEYYDEDDIIKLCNNNEKKLSFLNLNINGLFNKQEEFQSLLERLKLRFDIIAVSETHLNATSEKYTNIDGYKAVFNSRKSKGWGGVAIFIRSDITFIPRPDLSVFIEGIYESLFV